MIRFRRLHVVLSSALGLLALLALAGPASAQNGESTVTAEKDGAPTSADQVDTTQPSFLEGGGLKLTEDLIFHPMFELGTAYQTNVFYADDGDAGGTTGAPIMRLSAGGSLMSGTRTGDAEAPGGEEIKPKLAVRGDVNLTWNQYLSSTDAVSEQSDLGIGALMDLRFNPEGTFTFQIRDGFTRAVNPPSVEAGGGVDRDRNELVVGGIFKPGGGAIQAYANYQFMLDVFEKSSLDFANRYGHQFALGAKWQWLPKTQFNGEVSIGLLSKSSTYLSDAPLPLRVWLGTSTLITPTFGTVVRLGYGNGFYSGANFNSYLALVEGRLAVGPTVRFAFGYSHDFTDAIIANFYADHAIYARFSTQIAGRTQLRARGELRLRTYEGLPPDLDGVMLCDASAGCGVSTRSDVVGHVDASLEYQFRQWLIGGAYYSFLSDTTDFFISAPSAGGGADQDSAGFVWNEFMLKLTAKF